MKDESTVQQEIQIEGPRLDCILMRNNSGAAKDATGRVIFYGLGNTSKTHGARIKSSDCIGITTVIVTQEMVGKPIGVFTAIEVKEEKWKPTKTLNAREQAQQNFLDWVKSKGGYAGFANSVDSFRKILGY